MAKNGEHRSDDLLRRIAEGDEKAFYNVYDQFYNGLYNYAYKIKGNRPPSTDTYFNGTENNSQLVILNMIEETIHHLKTIKQHAAVGVLSTSGTKEAGIYRDPLNRNGFVVIEPDEALQSNVHEAIYNSDYGIKSLALSVSEYARAILLDAASVLIRNGAELIVLACTELPLAITENFIQEKPVIDPNRLLARALVRTLDPSRIRITGPAQSVSPH